MQNELILKAKDAKTYTSIGNNNVLTLCDPITQICKRIEAFFKGDSDITCRYIVNNHKSLGPKLDPDTGNPYTKQIEYDGETVTAIIDEDHLCEFRVFVADVEKAQCLSNVIRHKHLFPEYYEDTEGNIHIRNHYLILHVFTIEAIDPDGDMGGRDPWITDDDTSSGIKEIFGLEPINWDDLNTGCKDRLAPSDTTESDIPKGVPDEYEQLQWESNVNQCAWKWKWLQKALKGNKHIVNINYTFNDGMNEWKFIECNFLPVQFLEDNLSNKRGYNSILPADLLSLIFPFAGKFQIGTYVRP